MTEKLYISKHFDRYSFGALNPKSIYQEWRKKDYLSAINECKEAFEYYRGEFIRKICKLIGITFLFLISLFIIDMIPAPELMSILAAVSSGLLYSLHAYDLYEKISDYYKICKHYRLAINRYRGCIKDMGEMEEV